MDSTALKFLTEILGTEGARALSRTAQQEPSLGHVLVPRTALAWLGGRQIYEGTVPGVPNSYLRFKKSQAGFSGIVTLPDVNYEFAEVPPEHVAAALAVAVGLDLAPSSTVRDLTLVRLGKSIDALVKAQDVTRRLTKQVLDSGLGYNIRDEKVDGGIKVHGFDRHGKHIGTAWLKHDGTSLTPVSIDIDPKHQAKGLQEALLNHAKAVTGKAVQTDTQKTELPGATHKPTQQQGPQEPEAPQKQPPMAKPKLPKMPTLKVEKSEATKECPVCGGHQFNAHKFKGCICFRDLAKHIKVAIYSDGYVLEFGRGVDRELFLALRKSLKGDS